MAGRRVEIPDLRPFVISDVRPTGRDLGKGAYGSVEEVAIPGALCAAKKIHAEFLNVGSPEDVRHVTSKFVSECRLLSTLRHPQIVQFLGVCYLPGSSLPSLVMECLETNLHDLLETTPNLQLDLKRCLLLDVAKGLLYLHSQSPPIIHRDLTARNVLLNSAMTAKIADLGVARIFNVQPNQLATMTQGPGNIVYMPPEAFGQHTHYNVSLDVFSFGNLALFTLTQEFVGNQLKAATFTDPKTRKIIALSEIERREHCFSLLDQQFRNENPLVNLTRDCLQNFPNDRPSSADLVNRIEKIPLMDNPPSKLELMKQLSDKENEIELLQDAARERDVLISTLRLQADTHEQQITTQQEEIEKKDDKLKELQEQLRSQEAQIQSIEQRMSRILLQGGIPSSEMKELHMDVKSVRPARDELQFIPLSFKWEKCADLPFDVDSFHNSSILNGKVYISSDDIVIEYSPETDTWKDLLSPVHYHGAVLLNGQLALVGGTMSPPFDYSKVIRVWDSKVEQWTETTSYPPLPVGRYFSSCALYEHYLIVAGGTTSTKQFVTSKSVDILDTQDKKWYKAPPMPYHGHHLQSIIIGQSLYINPLYSGVGSSSKSVFRVSLPTLVSHAIEGKSQDSSVWERLPDVPYYATTLFSVGNMLLAAGGRSSGIFRSVLSIGNVNPSADIHLYNPHTKEWVKVAELPEAVSQCICTTLPSGRLLVAGGSSSVLKRLLSVYTANVSIL